MYRHSLVLLALSVVLTLPVVAQTGDDALRFSRHQLTASPAQTAMAGVGNVGMGSFTDLFQNPAGLGLTGQSSLEIGLNSLSARDESIFSVDGSSTPLSTSKSASSLNHLAWTYRFPTQQGSLVLAAGLARQSRFSREMSYDGLNPSNSITDYFMPVSGEFELKSDDQGVFPDFNRTLSFIAFETYAIDLDEDAVTAGDPIPFLPAVTAGTIAQDGVVSEKGGLSELSLGGSVEAAQGIFLGLSLNIPFGSYEFLRIHNEADIDNANDGTGGTTDFSSLRFVETFTSHVAGVNLRAGLSATAAPGVRVGLTVESPTSLSVTEDYDTQLSTRFDNGDQFSYGASSSEDAGRGTFEYSVTTPWRFGAGLAFERSGLGLYGDVTLVDWSALDLSSDSYAFLDENLATQQTMETTLSARVGGSYAVDKLVLRAGFGFDPDPHSSTSRTVDRSRTTFAAGASYQVSRQFALEFGWSMEKFDDLFNPYVEVTGAPTVAEQVTRHVAQIGIKMGF